jgi:hypothetical protein
MVGGLTLPLGPKCLPPRVVVQEGGDQSANIGHLVLDEHVGHWELLSSSAKLCAGCPVGTHGENSTAAPRVGRGPRLVLLNLGRHPGLRTSAVGDRRDIMR